MAKGAIKVGDEVMVRATVTAVWKDGHITLHINSAGQKITLPNASDIVVADNEPRAAEAQRRKAALVVEPQEVVLG
jgi:hypothetical protein